MFTVSEIRADEVREGKRHFWRLFDFDDDLLFEVPFKIAPDRPALDALLAWLEPMVATWVTDAHDRGAARGEDSVKAQLRDLLEVASTREVETLRITAHDRIDALVEDVRPLKVRKA